MPRFDYLRAQSVEHALELLADPAHVSRPLAGGTDLLVLIRHQQPVFDRVVDLTRVPEMKAIEQRRRCEIYIGAAASFTDAGRERRAAAVRTVPGRGRADRRRTGHSQCRHHRRQYDQRGGMRRRRALARVPRCGGAPGEHERNALAPGQRPGDRRERTAVRPGELLTHFTFPLPPAGARQAFTKLGRRNAQAISRLSMAAAGHLDEHGCVDYVRLVPGAAMPTPRRFPEVEKMLLGQAPTDDILAAAGLQDRRADARSHRPPLVDRVQGSRDPGAGRAHVAPGAGG